MRSSFDVFDTVITRSVSHPTAVFMLLGASAPETTPVEFLDLRIRAEREAEKLAKGGQATFDEIYQELGRLTDWHKSDLLILQQRELELEKTLIHAVPETLLEIDVARRSGHSILFISDMYLPSEEITELLIKSGAWQETDRLYVSCEWGANKRSGKLFETVMAEETLKANQFIHCGDNLIGDVQSPRKLGIHAKLVDSTALNKYEEVLDRYSEQTVGTSALLAGAARVARLKAPVSDSHALGLQVVACSVAAPVLTAFAGWVLQEANRRGIRRLYFVSRDGYVTKKFAERIATTMASAPEIRYLYGSRQAWRSISITHDGENDFSFAFESTAAVSVNAIFERLGTSPSLATDLLKNWGYPPSEWSRLLSRDELADLEEHFKGSDEIRECIVTDTASKRAAALAYLKQEGLFDDQPWAMVDLGWHGSLQSCLSSLLRTNGGSCPLGLYFGLCSRGAKRPADDLCAAFIFDTDRDGVDIPAPDLLYLMESFCTAPHGTCTQYNLTNGRYQPEFRQGHETTLAEWGLQTVHDAYDYYLKSLAIEFLSSTEWSILKTPVIQLLKEFSTTPGITEAQAWGRFPYENDQHAASTSPLATPKKADFQSLMHCMNIGELPHTFIEWRGGAWSQTKPLTRGALLFACKLGRTKAMLGRNLKRFLNK